MSAATIPSSCLYWVVVDPASLGRRLRNEQVGFLAEEHLPAPLEELHLAFRRLADGRVLVCGIERDMLQPILRGGALSASPSELPEFVRRETGGAVDAADINLLGGSFEPGAVRRARRTLMTSAMLVAACVSVTVCAGLIARGLAADRAALQVDERRSDLVRAVAPGPGPAPGSGAGGTSMPAELRLLAEMRELQSTRSGDLPRPADISTAASDILVRWPDQVNARLEHLRVTAGTASLDGWAATSADAQRIADALTQVSGWRLEPPQFRTSTDGVTFTMALVPTQKGGTP